MLSGANRRHLGHNALVGTLPDSLGSLSNLHFASFGINALAGHIPQSVCSLTGLTFLCAGVALTLRLDAGQMALTRACALQGPFHKPI